MCNSPPPPASQPLESDDLAFEDQGLFEILRKWRAERAHKDGVPPYVLLTNRQLLAVIKNRPQSKTEFMKINGIGQSKADRYGDELLNFIKMGALEQASPNV